MDHKDPYISSTTIYCVILVLHNSYYMPEVVFNRYMSHETEVTCYPLLAT